VRTQYSILIACPLEHAFAFVTQVENDLQWQAEIREVKLTSPLPVQVGATFREVRHTLGVTFAWDMRVTEFIKNQRICIESVNGYAPYWGCRTFESIEDKTRITETSEVKLARWMKPFEGMIATLALRSVAAAYGQLRVLLETSVSK
jgi:uncharacterized membrane protein